MINEDRLRTKNEITADQVRQLPEGTTVMIHHYDKYGYHVVSKSTLWIRGKRKMLRQWDRFGPIDHGILTESDKRWYSVEEV